MIQRREHKEKYCGLALSATDIWVDFNIWLMTFCSGAKSPWWCYKWCHLHLIHGWVFPNCCLSSQNRACHWKPKWPLPVMSRDDFPSQHLLLPLCHTMISQQIMACLNVILIAAGTMAYVLLRAWKLVMEMEASHESLQKRWPLWLTLSCLPYEHVLTVNCHSGLRHPWLS